MTRTHATYNAHPQRFSTASTSPSAFAVPSVNDTFDTFDVGRAQLAAGVVKPRSAINALRWAENPTVEDLSLDVDHTATHLQVGDATGLTAGLSAGAIDTSLDAVIDADNRDTELAISTNAVFAGSEVGVGYDPRFDAIDPDVSLRNVPGAPSPMHE
jgi:hypothetical protein